MCNVRGHVIEVWMKDTKGKDGHKRVQFDGINHFVCFKFTVTQKWDWQVTYLFSYQNQFKIVPLNSWFSRIYVGARKKVYAMKISA